MINIPKADWSSVKNKQLTATPCQVLVGDEKQAYCNACCVSCWSQTLKAEFTQQEEMLKDLESDAEKFREEKKVEAAERLDQQLSLLKVTELV